MQDLRENIFTDKAKLELTLAKEISQKLEQEIKKKGEATLLVSGGSTPKKLYEILSNTGIDWNNVSIGLIDERFVATDTDESNELLIKNTLLKNKAADPHLSFSLPLAPMQNKFCLHIVCFWALLKDALVLYKGPGA